MASQPVTDAVRQRISANWPRLPLRDLNASAKAAPANGFLVIEFPVSDEQPITVGSPGHNVFRESGALRLVMSIPRGDGTSPYAGWFDELRALFRNVTFDGVTTWAASPPTTDDRNDEGSFFRLSSAVPYQFDTIA